MNRRSEKRIKTTPEEILNNPDVDEELTLIKIKKQFVRDAEKVVCHYGNAVENTEALFDKLSHFIQNFSDFYHEEQKYFDYLIQKQKTWYISWCWLEQKRKHLQTKLKNYQKRFDLNSKNIKKAMRAFTYAPDKEPYQTKLKAGSDFFKIMYADTEKLLMWYEFLMTK